MSTHSEPRTAPGFWRTFASVFAVVLLLAVIVIGVVLNVVPRILGGTSLTVLSGSMAPTLSAGDVIAVRGVDPADLAVGDIVTFQPVSDDPTLVTHRIVGVGVDTQDGLVFTTRGDANGASDEPIVAAQVKGLYMYHVPGLGLLLQPLGGAGPLLAIVAGVGLIGFAVFSFVRPRARARARSGRTTIAAAAVVLCVALASAVALPATAAHAADDLDVQFTGPTLNVDWRGDIVPSIGPSFFGDRTVSPGDRIARQVRITNSGPSGAALTVRLTDVALTGSQDLENHLTLSWAMADESGTGAFAEIHEGDNVIADGLALDQGESMLFTLMLSYPADATGGAQASAGATAIDFDVQFVLAQTTPVDPLPPTGGALPIAAFVIGIVLVSLGIALAIWRRRKRDEVDAAN